jgi:hypothetical protein
MPATSTPVPGAACSAVKAAGDITVFTIRVMDGNADLLRA